ncbi:MAG: hypothetical protein K2X29_07040, partial [Candidatus Obscuribacterales bacterium]|nr:hypothetical protein [Candidatus Obscuribacterales bacterium]
DVYAEADLCKQATNKITIHAIGLAQNSYIIQGEVNNLNNEVKPISYVDQNGNNQTVTPSKLGIAGRGINKGLFYLVTDTQKLRYAFENLARHLVQLVKIG